jgi:hypothetical protein
MKSQNHHSIYQFIGEELSCHAPYGILAVMVGLAILSITSAFSAAQAVDPFLLKKLTKGLFHTFHFMHIVFATTGTILTFTRFSKNAIKALLVGLFSPTFFCLLSDVILPYIGAKLLGMPVKMHICIIEEPLRLLPFLCVGLANGLVMSYYGDRKRWFHALGAHAAHVVISALASVFFLASQGLTTADAHIGSFFILLIIAVIIPCTFSDLIVPMFLAKGGMHHHEEH